MQACKSFTYEKIVSWNIVLTYLITLLEKKTLSPFGNSFDATQRDTFPSNTGPATQRIRPVGRSSRIKSTNMCNQ